jgi:hypothetical protein
MAGRTSRELSGGAGLPLAVIEGCCSYALREIFEPYWPFRQEFSLLTVWEELRTNEYLAR